MNHLNRLFPALVLVVISCNIWAIGMPAKVPASSSQPVGTHVATTAEACLGKKMWTGYGLSTGYLGCAAAVSNVLKKAGFTAGHSAAVTQLRNQILASKCAREFVIRNGAKEDLLDSKLSLLLNQATLF